MSVKLFANLKMFGDKRLYSEYLRRISELDKDYLQNFVIFPPAIYLEIFSSGCVKFGAQNVSDYEKTSSTGEISAKMVRDIGAKYAIIGHSEVRAKYQNYNVNYAIKLALKSGLIPIICIGESKTDREKNTFIDTIIKQIRGIDKVSVEHYIAYEPIWSIGSGVIPSKEQIMEITNLINDKYINKIARKAKIIYGGSVNSENIDNILSNSDISGVLVGSFSHELEPLINLIKKIC